MRKWIRFLGKPGLAAGGCLVAFLILEVALRMAGLGLGTTSAFQPDPHCGARHVADFAGWHTAEGRNWVEINSAGFRDRERSVEKPPNTFRIAVIGDSFSEAFQVGIDKTYWSVMENQLTGHPQLQGRRLEVLNFGVSGYGTAQELQMLRHYVWDYQPDMIVLQFFAANDVVNNSRTLEPSKGRPFYTLDDDRLVLDDSFLQDADRLQFQASRWIRFKDFVIHQSRVAALIYAFRHRSGNQGNAAGEAGLNMETFREPTDTNWQDAWNVTDRLVLEVANEARSHDVRFVVLLANSGVQINPDDAVLNQAAAALEVADLSYADKRVSDLGSKHGFRVIPLAQPMREIAKRDGVYLHGFANTKPGTGHWNETGHRIAGKLAAESLFQETPPATADHDSREPLGR